MADLIYSAAQAAFNTTKFDTLYTSRTSFGANTELFFNNKPLQITHGESSLVLVGCAAAAGQKTGAYLERLLENFREEDIARVKTELAGQWILALRHAGNLYIFSDFLQIRQVYYAPEQRLVCSSFGPLHDTVGGGADSYKCFEFLSMRHCLYPVWLGNSTLNRHIRALRGFEYLKIGIADSRFEIQELTFRLDNTKTTSARKSADLLCNALDQIVDSPEFRDGAAYSTITGGFDSRLISAIVRKHHPDTRLRIAAFGESQPQDLRIALQVARTWSIPLDLYKTHKKTQKEVFFNLTDGLTPQENAITTELVLRTDALRIGFGGVLGTEILSSLSHEHIETLTAAYAARTRDNFHPSDMFLRRFTEALREEFETIAAHYHLPSPETKEKDLIRLFMASETSRFCGPQIATYDIYGRQMEPLATYPALAAALRIPYIQMGGKGTFGGFYLIPKMMMRSLDRRVSLIGSTHFSPMAPFGLRTFFAYVIGKFRMRRHFSAMRQAQQLAPRPICIETPDWSYRTTEWAEGFVARYLGDYSTNR